MLSQLLIKDFGSIPTNYQMPVAYCYAKGLLTGDENSNFNGSATTTRAQAAVVLCGLNDEKTQATAPTYTQLQPARQRPGCHRGERGQPDRRSAGQLPQL